MTIIRIAAATVAALTLGAGTTHAINAATTDTPTIPIDSSQMAAVIASGDPSVAAVCDTYGPVADATFNLVAANGGGPDDLAMMNQLVDAYEVVTLEGDTLRMSPEARTMFLDWLHTDCTS